MNLAGIKGKVVARGDEEYEESAYQYAFSSHEELVQPAAIIYAQDDDDVIYAIKMARENNFSLAVRTGGHQYSAASSTFGNNIQLDLSRTYTDFNWEDADHTVLTLGVSIPLGKFQSKIMKKGRFVPTGQCSYVNLGGHVQSGGYGQLIRSFGLLADHVLKVRIITADGQARWVDRSIPADKPLLYAILGGSPGNFGVLTDVTLKLLRDEDHDKSRGFRAMIPYSKDALKNLLDVMVKQDLTDDTAADYDFCVTVMGGRKAENKPAAIVVFAQALGGKSKMTPYDGVYVDDEPVKISELCSHWLFPISREFQLPYYKCTYMSNSRASELQSKDWTEWVTERMDDLESKSEEHQTFLSAQFQYAGGKHSTYRTEGAKNITSLSWRDSTFGCSLDAFYNGEGLPKARAKAWTEKNTADGVGHANAVFSAQDRRLLWGSFDTNLPDQRTKYYDQAPGKYDTLSKLKVDIDPHFVFTPNTFSVGPIPDRIRNKEPHGHIAIFDHAVKHARDVLACKKGPLCLEE
ncbi:hypothetical protein BGW38_000157 [Lunasporangiospora selenospora]|uniref:FAD-binding PCMH-type domain-containing protein n=1 Tax=Lunasporangiospora selenospora TaxID=979761 RepID=A0A9P6FVR4_9FUNG|nr:hypothetical protein BGW38_000157 [Lunasporangiospora selenospora]